MAARKITAEDQVRSAYAMAGGTPGEFVKLADMRYILCSKGMDFTAQDAVLTAMYCRQEVNLVPQSNQQALTADQRATALHCGGEAKHMVSIR